MTQAPVLLAVTPPGSGERTMLGVENLLQSIAAPEPFSLELAGDAGGVRLMARCLARESVRGQVAAHYPQARISQVAPEDDPLRLRAGEQAWAMDLKVSGPEHVPLRTFGDDDLLDPGSDPLLALIGALSGLEGDERIVTRLLLRSLGPDWSQGHLETVNRRAAEERPPASLAQRGAPPQMDGRVMAVLGGGALAALKAYQWVQVGESWKAALMAVGIAAALAAGAWAWRRFRPPRRAYDPLLIREKVSRIAFAAEVQAVAILPAMEPGKGSGRARDLLEPVAAAYRHYDNPAGARFDAGRLRPLAPGQPPLQPAASGLFRGRSVLGVREVAALWHPPGARDETPLVERSGSRALTPSPRKVGGGAGVGETTAGQPRPVSFPGDLLRRHHLYVARTRMGKSTLMQHVVAHKLRQKAAGRDGDAVVVVDPHADLVDALLAHVPRSIAPRVRLIDLANERGAVGVNLLDTRIFADRDRTADSVVRVARGLWDQWGPRMQSILEQTVKTLHEANAHPSTSDDEQFTILDALTLLSDKDYRTRVLTRVSDPYLLEWWARDFGNWRQETQADALAPVQTRLSYYASSKRARAILGQPRSTIDLRSTLHDGGVLLVSTAQGSAGGDVAALVGASLLNLVDAVIREQGSLPADKRRGALVVVDEMQSMPGVDYEAMLSELGKFGASFILATQSLAKLDDLSPTMRDTILANVGCLCVFQVAGSDARQLVWELGKERVSEDDVTSLPVHHCYVRATVGTERLPAFSMKVRRPEPGDAAVARRIRAEARNYVTPAEEIAAQQAEGRRRAEEFRKKMAAITGDGEPPAQEPEEPSSEPADEPPEEQPGEQDRSKQSRSKYFQPPIAQRTEAGEEGER